MGQMYFPDEIDPKIKNKSPISKLIEWCLETSPIRTIIILLIIILLDVIIFIYAFS